MKALGPDDPVPVGVDGDAPVRTAQVIRWRGVTRRDIAPEVVLQGAAGMRAVVVIGYDADGDEYFASSIADGADVLRLLERFKRQLLDAGGG